ncbi:MAG TPA: hypothetical protein VMH04_20065 [Candidatus Solibacter sp.]|nr:hypothetical protein [Candidatus Solibacter sp.]
MMTLSAFAKTPKVTGKIVGYDPLLHASKNTTLVANHETVVVETIGMKAKYVKLMFSSVGTTQIEDKYFDGSTPLTVQALRDHSCDERWPKLVEQVSLDQKSGTYVLTGAFKNSPPKIKTLECYEAIVKKAAHGAD